MLLPSGEVQVTGGSESRISRYATADIRRKRAPEIRSTGLTKRKDIAMNRLNSHRSTICFALISIDLAAIGLLVSNAPQ
jgi:hypothetical protein